MGSITTADKAVSTEEDPDDAGACGSGDGERLYKPEDEPENLQERLYHNTCLEVAQLQTVLNQLVENKVEAIKQEAAAAAQRTGRRKLLVMRLIRSPGAIVRRLKRRGSSSGDNKPSPRAAGGADQRQSGDRKRRKRTTDVGGNGGPHRGKRVNRQRIGTSSRSESPRYNPGGVYHHHHHHEGGGTPQHSDDDIVFLPAPCCCDADGQTTIAVDPAFDSNYISVNIDDDDEDEGLEDMAYAPEPQPLPCHLLTHTSDTHQHYHADSNSWRHSCGDMGAHGGPLPTLSGMDAHTDCSDEDKIKRADRIARRHRRRRRRKRRRKEERFAAQQSALGHRQMPPRLSTVSVSVDEVRVIDPDELSRKARLTIAATACLLLFMCLLLVGVTLRMAPLIDEMVREQNRDMLKSIQRESTTTVQPTPVPNVALPSHRRRDAEPRNQRQLTAA